MYETDRIKLVPFNREFLENEVTGYKRWFINPLVTAQNSHGLFPKSEAEYEMFLESIDIAEAIVFAILVKQGDEIPAYVHIGNVSLQGFNWIYRSAEFAVVLGEPDFWGKGYCTEATELLLKHGFGKLNLHRIWSGTASTNVGMQRVFDKLGFQEEGIFNDGMFLNGRYVDICCYYLLDWQWSDFFQKKGRVN